jgi:hypothetical protein
VLQDPAHSAAEIRIAHRHAFVHGAPDFDSAVVEFDEGLTRAMPNFCSRTLRTRGL